MAFPFLYFLKYITILITVFLTLPYTLNLP